MTETMITKRIMAYLHSLPQCWAYKALGNGMSKVGTPDIICCYKGRFVALEIKIYKGIVSNIQAYQIAKIQQAQGIAAVVYSIDDVKKIIDNLNTV